MATAMGFAQVGFLVLLCLSFCSASKVLTDSADVEKPNFSPSLLATQSTGTGLKSSDGISSLGDSKWQSGCKGGRCSGGGGGGGGSGNCGGNEGCGGCLNFGGGGGGGGSYCGGCGNFGCGGGGGGGYCGGNGGRGCGYACCGGNHQGDCYSPPPPTCYPVVSCPPVSNCCPVECPPGYGHLKAAAQDWSNSQSPASAKVNVQAQPLPDSKAPSKPNYSD